MHWYKTLQDTLCKGVWVTCINNATYILEKSKLIELYMENYSKVSRTIHTAKVFYGGSQGSKGRWEGKFTFYHIYDYTYYL